MLFLSFFFFFFVFFLFPSVGHHFSTEAPSAGRDLCRHPVRPAERAQAPQRPRQEPVWTDVRSRGGWECGRQAHSRRELREPGVGEEREPEGPEQELPLSRSQQRLGPLPAQPRSQREELSAPEKVSTKASVCLCWIFGLREKLSDMCPPGQKVATLPSAITAPVGVRHTTGASLHPRDATRTRRAGRKRRRAKPTSASAAAPGAAGARPRARPPETEAPARPSPPTTDRTTPGETPILCLAFFLSASKVDLDLTCPVVAFFLMLWRRERESANHSDTDSRARRRSRSYSPIRKRRRDSPSFMEARRITRWHPWSL